MVSSHVPGPNTDLMGRKIYTLRKHIYDIQPVLHRQHCGVPYKTLVSNITNVHVCGPQRMEGACAYDIIICY